jgi:hypothetical protein
VAIAAGQTLTLSGPTGFGINSNYGPSVEGPGALLTKGPVSLVAQTGGDYTDLYVGDGAAWTNSAMVIDAGLIQFGVKVNDTALRSGSDRRGSDADPVGTDGLRDQQQLRSFG